MNEDAAARRKARDAERLRNLSKRPKKGPRTVGSWYAKDWPKNDPYNPPPLPMEDDGTVMRPKHYGPIPLGHMKEPHRKSHFLTWYNYSGGSEVKAMQEAGIMRATLGLWKKDERFLEAMAEARREIADRLMYRLVGSVGIVAGVKIRRGGDPTLLQLLKFFQAQEPDAMPEESEPREVFCHNVPRPWKSASDNEPAQE